MTDLLKNELCKKPKHRNWQKHTVQGVMILGCHDSDDAHQKREEKPPLGEIRYLDLICNNCKTNIDQTCECCCHKNSDCQPPAPEKKCECGNKWEESKNRCSAHGADLHAVEREVEEKIKELLRLGTTINGLRIAALTEGELRALVELARRGA